MQLAPENIGTLGQLSDGGKLAFEIYICLYGWHFLTKQEWVEKIYIYSIYAMKCSNCTFPVIYICNKTTAQVLVLEMLMIKIELKHAIVYS